MGIAENIQTIKKELPSGVKLVAVSKFHPVESIEEAMAAGQAVFGENRPQEFEKKAQALQGKGIEWHFIGHLQTNKLKMVLPYAAMVESVDSVRLLDAINAWCIGASRKIDVLLEYHLGAEQTKHGMTVDEIRGVLAAGPYDGVRIRGLMGMATNTEDAAVIEADFARISALMRSLREEFPQYQDFDQLSIGMSDDWPLAVRYGATIVRIGSGIFGPREY